MRVSNSGHIDTLHIDHHNNQPNHPAADALHEPATHMSHTAERAAVHATAHNPVRNAAHTELREGSQGKAVRVMQHQLSILGFKPGPTDGDFGPRTRAALKRFQISRGISPNGVFDHRTDSSLDKATNLNIPRGVIREGDRGQAVENLQRALASRGFRPGPVDGMFGRHTESALRAFQRSRGVSSDGVFGPKTRAAFARGPVSWRKASGGGSVDIGHIGHHGNGSISYNGHRVSDSILRAKLGQIADMFGRRIIVTSGDRDYVPKGGSPHSLHLAHRAVDFHVEGLSDQYVFSRLRWSGILRGGYEVIRHGPYTATGGPHVHVGRYGYSRSSSYMIEGTSPRTSGVYTNV